MKENHKVRIWDLPLRLFHWGLAICVLGALITILSGKYEWFDYHVYFGYGVFCLIVFRIIWGFVGPTHARFSTFFPTPSRLKRYFSSQEHRFAGHNPLGANSVFLILFLFGLQAFAGLTLQIAPYAGQVVTDGFEGPFANAFSSEVLSWFAFIHFNLEPVLIGIIVLHVLAILFYQLVKKQRLVKPMITGDKETYEVPEGTVVARDGWGIRLFGLILFAAIVFCFLYFFVVVHA